MARPVQQSQRRVSTAVRLPVELHQRLCEQADWRDVSVNYLVTKAVTRYLDTLPFEEPDPRFGVPTERIEQVLDEAGALSQNGGSSA